MYSILGSEILEKSVGKIESQTEIFMGKPRLRFFLVDELECFPGWLGDIVFLTREEAEKALAERNEK